MSCEERSRKEKKVEERQKRELEKRSTFNADVDIVSRVGINRYRLKVEKYGSEGKAKLAVRRWRRAAPRRERETSSVSLDSDGRVMAGGRRLVGASFPRRYVALPFDRQDGAGEYEPMFGTFPGQS
jgi:hypothetical protein